jgi:sarcosine oxidase delta subunit
MSKAKVPPRSEDRDYRCDGGVLLTCPYCAKDPTGDLAPANDYALIGRHGIASYSKTQCGECDRFFSAERDRDGDIISVRREVNSLTRRR